MSTARSKPDAAAQWRTAIDDQATLLIAPEPRHRYLLSLVDQARRQGASRDLISEMLEITDSALLWAREETL